MDVLFETFDQVREATGNRSHLTEYALQQSMCQRYRERGLESSSPPIVAVNRNSGNPHYEPSSEGSAPILPGDLLLIDFWAKLSRPQAVYADYTWVAFLGESVPERIVRVWEVVREARDRALEFVRSKTGRRTAVRGWEVDGVARQVISRAGFGEYFIHRTGHSIGESDHGNGANLDGLETRDERLLIPRTCFSIEPGIYLPDFGIRSELNVYLGEEELLVTGDPIQQEIRRI
jgi:Xaa-Pro aminopeptidase